MRTAGQAMIKSVKANLSQMSSKNRYFNRKVKSDQKFDNLDKAPKLSKEELEAFSVQFKKDLTKWRIKVWGLTIIASVLMILITLLILSL